mgnify:CR=1 FL=1
MGEHPINNLMGTVMENIKGMVDVNTIIGDPVETSSGTIIIPVSKVGFGFAAGGSDFSPRPDQTAFGGGSGAGVSISPIGFLVVTADQIKLIPISSTNTPIDKLIDYIPEVFDKVNGLIKKNKNDN